MVLIAESRHQAKLENARRQLELGLQEGVPVHIRKGGVSHFVPLPDDHRRPGRSINIASLNEILSIDTQRMICTAEPGVTFAEVVAKTLPLNLIPAVVPELKGITLGGAVAGASIESSSYLYGTFHDTCMEYEILTSHGKVLNCSPYQDSLLFHMMHSSYGTLGILTSLVFHLVPARPYVHLRYLKFDNFREFEDHLVQHCRLRDYDFIDGIIHSPRDYVLCLGRFSQSAPYTSDYTLKDIYYKSTLKRSEDYLTTYDYCFRYDTECHWLSRTVPILEQKWFRLLAGRAFLGSTNLIRWSKRLERILKLKKRPDVICDVFIPRRNFAEFFAWYQEEFDYYPLWIVPGKMANPYPWLSEEKRSRLEDDFIIDCAVYGKPNNHAYIDYSRLLEDKTDQLGGIKTLISRNHYTQEHFWRIFNAENYERIKRRVDPNGLFANLYDKFH